MENQYTILVVKDEPAGQLFYKNKLGEVGFRVLIVDNCSKILTTMHGIQVDLLIIDLKIPEYRELDVIQSIRMEYSRLPIIVVTSFYKELKEHFLNLGDDIQGLYITPVDMSVIKRSVFEILGIKMTN